MKEFSQRQTSMELKNCCWYEENLELEISFLQNKNIYLLKSNVRRVLTASSFLTCDNVRPL